MDRFESQKARLAELVKSHHGKEDNARDFEKIRSEHPEMVTIGEPHEAYSCEKESEELEEMMKWGLPR